MNEELKQLALSVFPGREIQLQAIIQCIFSDEQALEIARELCLQLKEV